MVDSIRACLPEDYGSVTANFQEMPISPKIGIVLPTFSRQKYLVKTLDSLRNSSLPKDCMLVIVDETMASKRPTSEQYEYFENIDFEGGDIKQVNLELEEVRKEAERIDSCVAFNEAGWLKHSLLNPRPVQSSRFGTHIKKSFLQKNPTLRRQISQYVQTCKSSVDTEAVDEIKAFDMDIPIIKIYKKPTKHVRQLENGL
ncbi:MAG: glycosyltransferase [Syntrophotaleaceae bacterium]